MIPTGNRNGTGTVISVWFACKICRHSFQNIDNFLEHKKVVHLDEFQKLSCIVFEETNIANIVDYNLDDGSSLTPATVVIKQEQLSLSSSDDQHLDLKPVFNIAQAKKLRVKFEPIVCQIKNETATFPQNPYVLLQRLTSKEIQQYNKCQTQAFLPEHLTVVPSKSEARPFKCPRTNCGKALKTRKTLAVHLKNHTNHRPFKCSNTNCGKAFKARSNLMKHLRSHTQERLFKCLRTNCGKAYKTRQVLMIHLKSHTQEKAFKCVRTNCGKAYKSRLGLVLHLESHIEEKRFKCQMPDCEKVFSTQNRLKYHLDTQIHEKIFKCPRPNCEKAYSSRRSLRAHLETHTQEKKYKCQHPNCRKAFQTKNYLRSHSKIHSDSRPCFHCPFPSCCKVFRSKLGFNLHCVSRHSQDSTSGDKFLDDLKKCDRSDSLTNCYQIKHA